MLTQFNLPARIFKFFLYPSFLQHFVFFYISSILFIFLSVLNFVSLPLLQSVSFTLFCVLISPQRQNIKGIICLSKIITLVLKKYLIFTPAPRAPILVDCPLKKTFLRLSYWSAGGRIFFKILILITSNYPFTHSLSEIL